MQKFLSIIIPRYREPELAVFPLLSSINNQVGIDFGDTEVIICNDGGSDPLDGGFLRLFSNLSIRQTALKENKGPGMARQAGIDAANGQYLMFCDADDVLHNVGVLGAMMQEAERNVPDIICSDWLEETKDDKGNYLYVTHSHENTWMHGKLLRRQFLLQNGIRHHPDLRVHEDSYILSIAASVAKRSTYLDFISYVWKYQPDSITRRDGAIYSFDSIPTFIYACCEAKKIIELLNPSMMEYKVVQFTMYNYFCFHRPEWLMLERKDYLKDGECAFAENMKPFWHYYEKASPETIAKIYNEERAKTFNGYIESESLASWINRIFK